MQFLYSLTLAEQAYVAAQVAGVVVTEAPAEYIALPAALAVGGAIGAALRPGPEETTSIFEDVRGRLGKRGGFGAEPQATPQKRARTEGSERVHITMAKKLRRYVAKKGKKTYRRRTPKKLATIIRGVVLQSSETKRVYGQATVSPSTGGATYLINAIAQGTDANQRIGNQVRLVSAHIRLWCTSNAAATTDACRIVVFWDRQPDGGLANFNNIIVPSTPDFSLGPWNLDQVGKGKRIQILYDNFRTAQPMVASTSCVMDVPIGLKLVGKISRYTGTSAAIGDLSKGALILALVSRDATNVMSFNYSYQLTFKDF